MSGVNKFGLSLCHSPFTTEPVSLTFHSALRKLNTEPPIGASHQILVIWLNSYKEEDI
jgi:hypothetical protein